MLFFPGMEQPNDFHNCKNPDLPADQQRLPFRHSCIVLWGKVSGFKKHRPLIPFPGCWYRGPKAWCRDSRSPQKVLNPWSPKKSPIRPFASAHAGTSIPKLQDSGEFGTLTHSFNDADRFLPQLSRIKGDVQDKPLPDHRTGKAPQVDSRRA